MRLKCGAHTTLAQIEQQIRSLYRVPASTPTGPAAQFWPDIKKLSLAVECTGGPPGQGQYVQLRPHGCRYPMQLKNLLNGNTILVQVCHLTTC